MPDPGDTVWLPGDAEIEKSGELDDPTTSVSGMDWVKLPLAALRVSEYVPAVTFWLVLIVKAELAEFVPVIETGLTLKLEMELEGSPIRLRVTLPVKPFEGVTVMVSVELELTGTLMVPEAGDRLKEGDPPEELTVSVAFVLEPL